MKFFLVALFDEIFLILVLEYTKGSKRERRAKIVHSVFFQFSASRCCLKVVQSMLFRAGRCSPVPTGRHIFFERSWNAENPHHQDWL
jgi:hypothetical protein